MMEYRYLGGSGLKVSAFGFGTVTFGGEDTVSRGFGGTDLATARRLVDMCIDSGVNLFDSADTYSRGHSETMLGEVLKGRREQVLISTKATFRTGDGPNDVGSSRQHLTAAVEGSLRRLGTDRIDIFQLHGFDARTPLEETLRTLDDLVRAGKIRYIGCSNFSGWQLMKALAVSDRHGWVRHVAHQAYYSLVGRSFEWELMPLGLDQGVGTIVWSPLGWGRLTGRIRRGQPRPEVSRLQTPEVLDRGPPLEDEHVFGVVDALDAVAAETGRTVAQVALNWVLQRPTVACVLVGARTEEQLRENLGALGWSLTPDQMATLDAASRQTPAYPYWHQDGFERNPFPVPI